MLATVFVLILELLGTGPVYYPYSVTIGGPFKGELCQTLTYNNIPVWPRECEPVDIQGDEEWVYGIIARKPAIYKLQAELIDEDGIEKANASLEIHVIDAQ